MLVYKCRQVHKLQHFILLLWVSATIFSVNEENDPKMAILCYFLPFEGPMSSHIKVEACKLHQVNELDHFGSSFMI